GDTRALDIDEAVRHWKADGLDLTPVLRGPVFPPEEPRKRGVSQDHDLEAHFDNALIGMSSDALKFQDPVVISVPIHNVDRAVGTMLGNEVTRRFGSAGLAPETID